MSKIKHITLAPSALDRNGISTTETLASARLDYLINGALATGYDRNGIATSQAPTSAAAMTLDGATMGTPNLRTRKGVYILIYAAGNDTGRTFTVVGEDGIGNVIREEITGPGVGLIVLGSTRFWKVTSVTPDAATAGNIEIGHNGYVDLSGAGAAQHVAIYSAGDDSTKTITVTGENRYGDSLTESITGANAGTSSSQALNFGRVDRLTASAGTAGATEAGVDGKCEAQWFVLNYRGGDFNVGLGVDVVSGTLTYAIQHTFQNVLASDYTEGDETVFTHDTLTGQTTDADGNYTNPPAAIRLAFTAYTSGSAILHIVQGGS
jgi:hypothetical protein